MTTQKSETKQDALAVVQQGAMWDREMLDLVKKSICPAGITDTEFQLFVEQCKVRGLNPIAGEAFCVPRQTKIKKNGAEQWVDVHVLQTSVEGMRVRAHRHGDLEELSGEAIYEKDSCFIDKDAGKVKHTYEAAKPRGAFMGAWAKVVRRGMKPFIVHLLPGSRKASGPVFANNPGEHLRKCAMAAALREAYPTAFGGVYTSDEMPSEAAPGPMERVMGEAPREEPALPPVAPKPTVAFGEWKGQPIEALAYEAASAAIAFAEVKMMENPKAKWAKAMRENMEAIRAHRDALVKALPSDTTEAVLVSPEPTEAEMAEIRAREEAST